MSVRRCFHGPDMTFLVIYSKSGLVIRRVPGPYQVDVIPVFVNFSTTRSGTGMTGRQSVPGLEGPATSDPLLSSWLVSPSLFSS